MKCMILQINKQKALDAISGLRCRIPVLKTKEEGSRDYQSWKDEADAWTSFQDGFKYNNGYEGVQVTAAFSGAGAVTINSYNNVTKVEVTYCTNTNNGI